MCLCATSLETPFGRVESVGCLQPLPKSWPWDYREKKYSKWSASEYASNALTQPSPPLFPEDCEQSLIFFKVTKVAVFCPYALNDNKNSPDLIG